MTTTDTEQTPEQEQPRPVTTGRQLLDDLAARQAVREKFYRTPGELEVDGATLRYYYSGAFRKRYSL